MVIFGFMLNYALRVNLTIAIVAMVVDHKPENSTIINGSVLALNNTSSAVRETAAALASAPNLGNATDVASFVAPINSSVGAIEKVSRSKFIECD